jgi:hypothetical protein
MAPTLLSRFTSSDWQSGQQTASTQRRLGGPAEAGASVQSSAPLTRHPGGR